MRHLEALPKRRHAKHLFIFGFAVAAVALASLHFIHSSANSMVGDINGDGVINQTDLTLLENSFGYTTTACITASQYTCDLDGDGTITGHDMSLLLADWGNTTTGGVPVSSIGPYFAASTGGTTACTAGCAVVGQTLGVNTGTWSNSPTSYTYQWERCTTTSAQPPTTGSCSVIGGATSSTYTVASADLGHSLVPIVTAHNGAGASSPTVVTGSCDTGEIVATGLQSGGWSSPEPTAQQAGCSPISAVVASTQSAESFCTNAVTTCGYADPLNGTAGVPAGTTLSTTGACSPSSIATAAATTGGVINGCVITNGLDITANNVVVKNSDIVGNNNQGAVIVDEGNTGTRFLNDSIHGSSPSGTATAAWAIEGDNIDEENVYAYNVDRILMLYPGDGSSTVNNSFCWNNGEAGDEHHECIYGDGGASLTATNDILYNLQYETAAIFIDSPQGNNGGTNGVLNIANNIFSGGTYTIYGGYVSSSNGHAGAESFTGNRWSRLMFTDAGQFGAYVYLPPSVTWSGNQWDDTNAAL